MWQFWGVKRFPSLKIQQMVGRLEFEVANQCLVCISMGTSQNIRLKGPRNLWNILNSRELGLLEAGGQRGRGRGRERSTVKRLFMLCRLWNVSTARRRVVTACGNLNDLMWIVFRQTCLSKCPCLLPAVH